MALIYCPECSKEISDSASACPHCGFALKTHTTKTTELGDKRCNYALGIVCILCGIIAIFVGIPMIAIIIGVFVIIGGIMLFGWGVAQIIGLQDAVCPYCDSKSKIIANSDKLKCPTCKKISVRKDNFLEAIVISQD